MARPARTRLLRTALFANASFSSVCALVLLARPDQLVQDLGVSAASLRGTGASLAAFVVMLVLAARAANRTRPQTLPALLAVALDSLWVVGSLLAIPFMWSSMSPLGRALFVAVAAVVGLLGLLQYVGIGQVYARANERLGTSHHLDVHHVVDAPPERVWPVIADLGGITQHAAGIVRATVDGEPGLGATRTCENHEGKRWSEHVTDWKRGRTLEVRFMSEREGFPFPMEPMHGGWEVDRYGDDGCQVSVWWAFRTKPSWLAPLLIPVMERQVQVDMRKAIDSMGVMAQSLPVADT